MRDRSFGTYRGVLWAEVFQLLEPHASNTTVIFDCGYATAKPRNPSERARALPIEEIAWDELPTRRASIEELLLAQLESRRHPHVIVSATKPGLAAFEAEIAGHVSGHLTAELCASLRNVRNRLDPWSTIIDDVRRRIIERRGSWTQEPQVFGLSDQAPFSAPPPRRPGTSTLDSMGLFPTYVDAGSRVPPSVPETEELIAGASQAIKSAIDRQRKRGIPTTHMIDGEIVRVDQDGRVCNPQTSSPSR